MARVEQKPCGLACVGMLAGLLLLGFAGTLLVMSPSVHKEVATLAEGSHSLLSRRLQDTITDVVVPQSPDLLTAPTETNVGSTACYIHTSAMTCPVHQCEWNGAQCQEAVGSSEDSANSMDSSSGSGSSLRGESWQGNGGGSSGLSNSSGGGMTKFGGLWLWLVSSNLGTLLLMVVFAVCYYHNAVAPVIMTKGTLAMRGFHYTGKDDFDNSIFGCFDDVWVLIHGCCCPLVRMSHTNAVAGVSGYWESAICWFCCAALTGGVGPCCLMVYWRKQLKDIMGLEDNLINDICITFFCWPLSIIQQGIAVDHASGYEVTGCCTLEWSGHHQV